MILNKLPSGHINFREILPAINDHCLFTETVTETFVMQAEYTGPGIIAMLQGRGNITVNDAPHTLDENSFVVVNRGSKLMMKISQVGTKPVLLFFNQLLSELIANSVLFKYNEKRIKDLHDFTLVEHIHYANATLKDQLTLLIDLGDSCASFHALKADMIIRKILDDLIQENHNATRVSENIDVVKKSTRIELYKRLTMARDWMEKNYASPVDLTQASNVAMLNRQHFLRLFKQAFQITPHQYLTEIRIKNATELLVTTEELVSVICQRVGFESISSFSVLFKKRFGVSPNGFRRKYQSKSVSVP